MVTGRRASATVGRQSSVYLRAGERLTVRDLVEAALIQSANDAAVALAAHVGSGTSSRFVELMNRRARELGLRRHALRAPRRPRRARARTRRARDVTRLGAHRDDASRSCAHGRAAQPRDDRRRPVARTPGTTCSASFPGLVGVKTGHTARAGWCAGRGGPRAPASRSTRRSSAPDPRAAQRRPRRAARVGPLALPRPRWSSTRPRLRDRRGALRPRAGRAGRAARRCGGSSASAGRSSSGSSRRPSVVAAGRARAAARRGARLRRRAAGRARAARRGAVGRRARLSGARRLVRGADVRDTVTGLVLVIVTVTLNAAIDRTLTVPNFQLGQRHRASQALTLAAARGSTSPARSSGLGVPVVATGLAGGGTGHADRRGADRARRSCNDFVRIGDESRTSTAVVDPTAGTYTEINEWGPRGRAGRARDPAREAPLPLAAARVRRLRGLAAAGRRRRTSTPRRSAS